MTRGRKVKGSKKGWDYESDVAFVEDCDRRRVELDLFLAETAWGDEQSSPRCRAGAGGGASVMKADPGVSQAMRVSRASLTLVCDVIRIVSCAVWDVLYERLCRRRSATKPTPLVNG